MKEKHFYRFEPDKTGIKVQGMSSSGSKSEANRGAQEINSNGSKGTNDKELKNQLIEEDTMDWSHRGLDSLSPDIFECVKLKSLNLSHNQLSELPKEISRLLDLEILDLSSNKFKSLPTFLGKLWQIRILKLQGNEIEDPEVVSYINASGDRGAEIISYLLDKHDVHIPPLPRRPMIDCEKSEDGTPMARFSVLSYNILAQVFIDTDPAMYAFCPKWAQKWSYRSQMILNQIADYNTDIIAMQEVEETAFNGSFGMQLAKLGYQGTIVYREDRIRNGMLIRDGNAIFFKKSKFELMKTYSINHREIFGDTYGKDEEQYNRIHDPINIDTAALLKLKQTPMNPKHPDEKCKNDRMILIANCHLIARAKVDDIKFIQTCIVMHQLENFRNEALQEYGLPDAAISTIQCGDYNSYIDFTHTDFVRWPGVSKDTLKEAYDYDYSKFLSKIFKVSEYVDDSGKIKEMYVNPRPLKNCYNVDPGTETMKVTHDRYLFKSILDHMFYEQETLRLVSILGDIDHQWFKDNEQCGFICPEIPSDHLPLLSVFELKNVDSFEKRAKI